MSSRRDPELEDLLADLETTLDELRSELRSSPGSGPPRPPRLSELLRFTEEYTIPTVIAVLEATIRSLELLQRLLRLADPGRTGDGGVGRERTSPSRALATGVGRDAADQVTRALEELQRALSEADLPQEPESRSILEDARSLSAEIEDRLAASRRSGGSRESAGEYGERRRDREESEDTERRGGRPRDDREQGVRIDVTDASGEGRSDERGSLEPDADAGDAGERGADDASVDVESELQSIKDELDASRTPDEPDHDDADPADAEQADAGAADPEHTEAGAADGDAADGDAADAEHAGADADEVAERSADSAMDAEESSTADDDSSERGDRS